MMDWKQYQEEAAALFRSLGFKAEVNHVVEGVRSKHVIDVYVTFDRWGLRHTWIVECKRHARPITKADVETLKSIASEIGASLAFLLSESGFQSGAFDAARKTNVVLSSLEELRTKSRDDVMSEALIALENRALALKDKIFREFMCDVEKGCDYITRRVRDGVDGERFYSMIGSIAMLNVALDDVRLGYLPATLPGDFDKDPDAYVRCTTLDQLVAESNRVVQRVEKWVAKQSPR
ncbi:MAG: hypothetical protein DME69_13660 [Verrucomicrobia bacterium]|nr:MAG: hypothetical protein DME69_13660 [Verrucomicrobiota bacterium]